jgi:ribose/xylose/arabinose/galactoside ABC-type transport system permease subunit
MLIFFSFNSATSSSWKLRNILIAGVGDRVISTAMTAAIIGRGPDLSVGAMVAMSGCILATWS